MEIARKKIRELKSEFLKIHSLKNKYDNINRKDLNKDEKDLIKNISLTKKEKNILKFGNCNEELNKNKEELSDKAKELINYSKLTKEEIGILKKYDLQKRNNDIKKEDLTKEKRKLFKESDEYYHSMIFNPNDYSDIEKLQIELVRVKSSNRVSDKKLLDIWRYYRIYQSNIKGITNSNKFIQSCGRNLKYLVKDKNSDKYIGILELSNDTLFIKDRDIYIGWDKETCKKKINKNILNISCCIPLQPFGYNFNGGKLLASLAFSDVIKNDYYSQYKDHLACIVTTSIYGKSIQYENLKNLKLIGYTKGTGASHIPESLYERGMDLLREMGTLKTFSSMDKIRRLKRLFIVLNISENILEHGNKRGYYLGFTSSNSKEFLNENQSVLNYSNIDSIENITNEWKNKWALKRYQKLKESNLIKNNLSLIKVIKNKKKTYLQKHRENKKEENEEEYKRKNNEYMKNYRKNKEEEPYKKNYLIDWIKKYPTIEMINSLPNKSEGKTDETNDKENTSETNDKENTNDTKSEENTEETDSKENKNNPIKYKRNLKLPPETIDIGNKIINLPEQEFELRYDLCDIYLITNIVNNKKYIGKASHFYGKKKLYTTGYQKRLIKHCKASVDQKKGVDKHYCKYLNNAINKYGIDNFEIVPLVVCANTFGSYYEMKFIKEYDTFNNGYNLTKGGEGSNGTKRSPEYCEKMSKLNKGENNPNYGKPRKQESIEKFKKTVSGKNHHYYGKKLPPEHVKKMSDAKMGSKNPNYGKKRSSSHSKKIADSIKRNRKEKLSDENIIKCLKMKLSDKLQQDIVSEFNMTRDNVTKIWNGTLKPFDESLITDEYLSMVNYKRKKGRNKKRVLTDKQITEIYNLKDSGKSLSEVASLFKREDGKKITNSMICDIFNKKLTV